MKNRNLHKRLAFFLFAALPIVITAPGSSLVEGCWVESSLSTPAEWCQEGKICVEWELQGGGFATDCCSEPPEACESCASAGRIVRIQTDLLPRAPEKDGVYPRHTPPRIPILVDHQPVAPEDIGRFDGVPLHFLVCLSETGEALQAFTTREGLALQLEKCLLGNPSFIIRDVPEQATAGIVFYEGRRWNGAPYHLPAGQWMALGGGWWDDRIRSLRGFGAGTVVTVFENADLSGSTLTLTTDLAWPDLGFFGWQGRVSALFVWPPPLAERKPYLKDSGE